MYCPKCGQSQASAEVRFCSRCGFPLVGVADLLSTGGMLPLRPAGDENWAAKPMSPRRRGVKQGAALLLIGIFLIPFFGIMHEAIGLPGEFMALGAIAVMAAILRIIFAAFFEEGAPRATHFTPQPQHLYAPPPQPVPPRMNAVAQEMLPPAQQQPQQQQQQGAPAYRQPQVDTAQIMHPPSVTDHTTRLLEKQSDPSER
jgi:hypothetical protein